jgi:ISXO2-like transposase domain
MFLRCKVRRKDGKQHRYWSVVENTRVARGRVVQRHVLYLGEINDTQELAWRYGVYHHVSEHHLKRYLAEFDFRYNERVALGVGDVERTEKALRGIVGKRLTYREPRAS